jgi:hypothetical protein
MKIGIIGAPGSGKSKFAKDLGKAYDLAIVDNYVQHLKDNTNLELGYWASYSENFMIAGVRMAIEHRYKNAITAGTILDTILYCAIKHDIISYQNETVRQAAQISEYAKVNSAMNGMGMMYTESWLYDLAFYLPLEEQAVSKDSLNIVIDNEIPNLLEVFNAPVITLTGNHDDKVRLAKEVITIAFEDKVTPSE